MTSVSDLIEITPEARLARRLKKQREQRGWTQIRFAVEMGQLTGIHLDPTAITRIERGERSVRLNEAVAIAMTLDLLLDELIAPMARCESCGADRL